MKILLYKEVKDTESKEFKNKTHVAMIVEPSDHLSTQTENK